MTKTSRQVARVRSLLILLAPGLLVGCGRSERHVGGSGAASSVGDAGDSGAGGSTSGAGGTTTTGGAAGTGGDAGGTAGNGSGGKAGAAAAGGASGTGGSVGGAGAGTGGSAGKADCTAISDAYEAAFEQAKHCEPTAKQNQCTLLVGYGFQCGEQLYVNPDETEALAAIKAASTAYAEGNCAMPVTCGAAPNPIGANCSPEGVCETIFDNGGTGCQVDGVLYPHGTTGIQPSFAGCDCECSDGHLICPDGCVETCPGDQTTGEQCASCGPTDACLVVETLCLDPCTDSCPARGTSCVSGVCIFSFCG